MNYELNNSILSWPLFRRSGAWQVLTILLIKTDDTGRSMTNRRYLEDITGLSAITIGAIMRDLTSDGIIEEDGDAIWVRRLPNGVTTKQRDHVATPDSSVTTSQRDNVATPMNSVTTMQRDHVATPKRFIKPTLDEVAAYITSKGYHFAAEEFIAHYESNGWRVGKNPMKKWQAACVTFERTWKRDQERYQQRLNTPYHANPSNYQQQRDSARQLFASAEAQGYVAAGQLAGEEPILLPE